MAYSKAGIYNLTFSALLLLKEVENVDTDTSTEVRVLNLHWETAFWSTLKDLDLDCLSSPITLELIEELDEGPWYYAYKYPTACAKLRRIVSGAVVDNKYSHVPKQVRVHGVQKAIFTNKEDAVAECIPNSISLALLPPMAAMALSYKLAMLSAPLITGKGARALIDSLQKQYLIAKGEAQEDDAGENFIFEDEATRSEFVNERTS